MFDNREGSDYTPTGVLDPAVPSPHPSRAGTADVRQPGLSVVVITGNEERNLRRCLTSVAWADEIIVVDSFSTDRTLEIAREFTSKVVQQPWPGYAAQKAYAVSLAGRRWVLSLDADEELTPELADAIRHVVQHDTAHPQNREGGSARHDELPPLTLGSPHSALPDGYSLRRRTFFIGRPLHYAAPHDWQMRLFLAGRAQMLDRLVHESFSTSHPARLHGAVLNHYTAGTIEERFETINRFSTLEAADRRRWSRRFPRLRAWACALFWPPRSFIGNYVLRLGFLDGLHGLVWCFAGAIERFLVAVKQLERIHADELPASAQVLSPAPELPPLTASQPGGQSLCA